MNSAINIESILGFSSPKHSCIRSAPSGSHNDVSAWSFATLQTSQPNYKATEELLRLLLLSDTQDTMEFSPATVEAHEKTDQATVDLLCIVWTCFYC